MSVLMPTHSCFDDSLQYISDAVLEDKDEAILHLRLVHGICLAPEGPEKDRPFSHAWVEQDRRVVIQCALLDGEPIWFGCLRKEFYLKMRVQVSTVYTVEEAVHKNWEKGTYGPWDPAYLALCGHGSRVVFRAEETEPPT
jgi:hypothetical protein